MQALNLKINISAYKLEYQRCCITCCIEFLRDVFDVPQTQREETSEVIMSGGPGPTTDVGKLYVW